MRPLTLLFLLVTGPAIASSPDPKNLAVPAEELRKARELVKQLGSEDYEERAAAFGRLAKMGRLAMPVLAGAANADPDPEVRSRCRSLLPRAEADEMKARLETFLADVEGKYEHNLPGWNEFKKVVGAGRGARDLFVEMLGDSTNRMLLLSVGGSETELGSLVASRKAEMYNWRFPRNVKDEPRRDPTPADITALLFAESHVASRNVPRNVTVTTLLSTPAFRTSVTDGSEKGEAMKAVIGQWLETRDDPTQLYQGMTIANTLDLKKECARTATKLLNTAGAGTTTTYRLYAAFMFARLGAKEHAATLEKHLTDQAGTQVARSVNGEIVRTEVQVRDASLAALLHLSGQDIEDYGFVNFHKGVSSTALLTYTSCYLPDSAREAAFGKWKAWRAKHPNWGAEKEKK